jgi:choline dehydrogenase-like flavoprotein
MADTLVKRVIFSDKKRATGVELAEGRVFSAEREVILSAGTLRTPQLLMLSGIGQVKDLKRNGIEQIVKNEQVGKNLWDHLAVFQVWKLRNPEIGAALGSDKWTDPKLTEGALMGWWTNLSVPREGLRKAMLRDNSRVTDEDSLLAGPRCHLGLLVYYIGRAGMMDGNAITTLTLNNLPTSRGYVTLASPDPNDHPVIYHNHLSAEKDRFCLRIGTREILNLMNTTAGKDMVIGEFAPSGNRPLATGATHEKIDARIKEQSQ